MPNTFPEAVWIFPNDPSDGKVQASSSYFQYSALFSNLEVAGSYLQSIAKKINYKLGQ